jgi:hypothetical protein
MNAEIIKRKSFFTKVNKNYGEQNTPGLYVKFTDSKHKKWIGRFAKTEEEGICKVIEDQKGSQCLVIANGKGYLVDIEKQTVMKEFDEGDHIISALHTTKPNYFVAGTDNSIFIINQEGKLKEILPDFSVEGFNLRSQQENTVSGWLESSINQFENTIFFKVDLSNFNLILNY